MVSPLHTPPYPSSPSCCHQAERETGLRQGDSGKAEGRLLVATTTGFGRNLGVRWPEHHTPNGGILKAASSCPLGGITSKLPPELQPLTSLSDKGTETSAIPIPHNDSIDPWPHCNPKERQTQGIQAAILILYYFCLFSEFWKILDEIMR